MSRDFLQHRSVRCTFVLNTVVLFLSRSIFILQKVGQKPRSTPWLFMKCMSNCRRRSEQYLRLGPTRKYILLSVTIAFLLYKIVILWNFLFSRTEQNLYKSHLKIIFYTIHSFLSHPVSLTHFGLELISTQNVNWLYKLYAELNNVTAIILKVVYACLSSLIWFLYELLSWCFTSFDLFIYT